MTGHSQGKKVAIVHDYFNQFGGAEKVVEKWLQMYPQAELYTTMFAPEKFSSSQPITQAWTEGRVRTSWLQKLFAQPKMLKYFKHLFWAYPIAMSSLQAQDYDLVLISSSYPAKNIRLTNCSKIIHYCHSPVRFLYNMDRETDLKAVPIWLRVWLPLFQAPIKWLDQRAAAALTAQGAVWMANSSYLKQLQQQVYGVDAKVVYPPVDLGHFLNLPKTSDTSEPFYYYFGRISFHKKIHLLIQACLQLKRRLYICGAASLQVEMDKLQQLISEYEQKDPKIKGYVRFLGRLPDEQRDQYLAKSQAFLFAGKEDFGIALVEALASGTPMVAYQAGGALDFLQPGTNGVFFPEQTVESIKQAIVQLESTSWQTQEIRDSVRQFSEEAFEQAIRAQAGF